ncbi:MAG: hypothetical protein ACREAZ_04220 [Nitrososphaera sp.]
MRIELSAVKVGDVVPGEVSVPITVTFRITNPIDRALTTSKIEYELFADGVSLGQHILSYEDVPPPGRPPLFKDLPTNLSSSFLLSQSATNDELFDRVASSGDDINWSVTGTAVVESALTSLQKEFSDEL